MRYIFFALLYSVHIFFKTVGAIHMREETSDINFTDQFSKKRLRRRIRMCSRETKKMIDTAMNKVIFGFPVDMIIIVALLSFQ